MSENLEAKDSVWNDTKKTIGIGGAWFNGSLMRMLICIKNAYVTRFDADFWGNF